MTKVTAEITITGHLRVFADPLDKVRWCGPPMSQDATASEIVLSEQVGSRALMLFDGLCGLCNSAVRWVTQQDHADRFRFTPLQSELTAVILNRHGISREAVLQSNTVYLVLDAGTEHERLLTKSNVTVNMLLLLGGRWRVLGYLLRAVPTFLRDTAYGLFARNRYRLTGRYEVCPLPTDAERMKFLR
jgi:predicted DCC family thiol-disulfide oxidoreductase YuxK